MFPGAPGVGEGGVSLGSAAQETPGPPSCAPQSSLQAAGSLALWDGGQLRGEGHAPPPTPHPLPRRPTASSLAQEWSPWGYKSRSFTVRLGSDLISIRWSCVTFVRGLTSLSLLPSPWVLKQWPREDLVTWPWQVFQQKLFAGASGFGLRPAMHLVGTESMRRTGSGRLGGSVCWASDSWFRLKS